MELHTGTCVAKVCVWPSLTEATVHSWRLLQWRASLCKKTEQEWSRQRHAFGIEIPMVNTSLLIQLTDCRGIHYKFLNFVLNFLWQHGYSPLDALGSLDDPLLILLRCFRWHGVVRGINSKVAAVCKKFPSFKKIVPQVVVDTQCHTSLWQWLACATTSVARRMTSLVYYFPLPACSSGIT